MRRGFLMTCGRKATSMTLLSRHVRAIAECQFAKQMQMLCGSAEQDYFRKLPRRHHPDFHWLFIGGAGSVTPLHVDPSGTHAWLTQIHGRKRFTLFAPCEMAKLLKETPGGGFKPLREILSERLALSLEVVLHPGDTLFVPAHWPHEVECLDDSISVTWNFLGQSVFPLVRAAFLAHTTR